MAKRKARKIEEEEYAFEEGGGGILSSIIAVVVIAVGVVMILALVNLAGTAGNGIDDFLASVAGMGRIIFPLILLGIGTDMILGDRRFLSIRTFVSIAAIALGVTGLLHVLFVRTITDEALRHAGGFFGLVFGSWIAGSFGGLVAGFLSVVAIVVGVIGATNVPLGIMLAPLLDFLRAKKEDLATAKVVRYDEDAVAPKKGRKQEEVEEEEEIEEEREEEREEEGGEEEEKSAKAVKVFQMMQSAKKEDEQVVTSSEPRRTVDIPMDLLDNRRSEAKAGDITRNQEIIAKTLRQFGIDVEMSEVRVGPTVTQYAFRPAQGVKLARVVALQNDLALALAAHPIRIEAPIPGKALVGVEVPNQTVARVTLRELIESQDFEKRKSAYAVPLGRDIAGSVPLLQVERAPHMLVAGATGSGKSVCLNTMIISLLYQNGPDDLKLIMVDPKRVELGVYAGIPHLLVPPIVKAEEAVNALKWAVREMERRLDYLAKFNSKDIDSYNAKSSERMPRIIIIIDELADLMIQNKRDVEATVVRIAQMARAAGIHLILATQRPSVDVITGTIKANIPTRLAFAVASQVDSKTILDVAGAEKLLGRGDMLLSNAELSKPKRIQGAYIAEEEIEKVVEFLKKESAPDYNYQITEGGKGENSGGVAMGGGDADPLLEEAIQIAIDAGRVSTSYLQRRMKIGYSRAARMLDLLEEMGVVGSADGAKPREVLVTSWPPHGSSMEEEEIEEEGEEGQEEAWEAIDEGEEEYADEEEIEEDEEIDDEQKR
ncbi:DNA translocase FtsK [bacterium]|nr:DNA translocase FtsK [bacterium]